MTNQKNNSRATDTAEKKNNKKIQGLVKSFAIFR